MSSALRPPSLPLTARADASGLAGLGSLRAQAGREPKRAVQEAARQFEALFMQELMKSMRQATQSAGMLDNEGTKLGTELLDTELSTRLTGMPRGLSEAIVRQLELRMQGDGAALPGRLPGAPADGSGSSRGADADAAAPGRLPAAREGLRGAAVLPHGPFDRRTAGAAAASPQAEFVQRHQAAARAAEAASGIPADFMLAQAAHESGWGRRPILRPDGASAHNLFGIKAGPGWQGPVAEATTTEFIDGRAHKTVARFRAYASPEAAFQDYARLIQGSPRYREAYRQALAEPASALSAAQYAQSLQRAGYATDPHYADKLARLIDTTRRLRGAEA